LSSPTTPEEKRMLTYAAPEKKKNDNTPHPERNKKLPKRKKGVDADD